MVQKSDWKTLEMPPRTASFTLSYPLADSDLAAIREGHRPEEMEDKWFMYCEGDALYIHRSWTGYCIYAVALSQTGSLAVTVNRDPAQHKETVVEADRNMVELLLNRLTDRNGRSAALMQAYLSRKSRPQP